MHHFCWALVDSQKGYDGQALGNLDYVLRNSSKSFKLRPMVLKQKALILEMNNNLIAAVPVYRELIDVAPNREDGYLGLSRIFSRQGDKETAREIIEFGLENIPDSEKLKSLHNQ
jgi:tetratricopeptide (TPR) repeat protein